MREWKDWDVLEGKFNEKMEGLGVLEGKFNEVMEGWMYLKESSVRRWKGGSRGGQDERSSMRKSGKVVYT